MSVQITSINYNSQIANVILYSSTGNTIPYTNATQIALGVQTIPFIYSSSTLSNEYGVFSCNFTGFSKTCIISQKTPPDGDGNTYNTIKIGNQIWMSENLKTKKFQNGTPLDNIVEISDATWGAANGSTTRYWATYGDISTFGLLYNQFALLGSTVGGAASGNICPAGWHVPTNAEFSTLVTTLGVNGGVQAKSTTLWLGSGNRTNSSGFNFLPNGFRISNGRFFNILSDGYYWATSGNPWALSYLTTEFNQPSFGSVTGCSVRCLKN